MRVRAGVRGRRKGSAQEPLDAGTLQTLLDGERLLKAEGREASEEGAERRAKARVEACAAVSQS